MIHNTGSEYHHDFPSCFFFFAENAQGTTTPSETAGEGNEEAKGDAEKPVLTQEWVSACVQVRSGPPHLPPVPTLLSSPFNTQ